MTVNMPASTEQSLLLGGQRSPETAINGANPKSLMSRNRQDRAYYGNNDQREKHPNTRIDMNKLGRLNPISVFGILFCCVGFIWTIMEHIRYCNLVNELRNQTSLEWWPVFVPVYGNIYLTTMAKELNSFILEKNLSVPPANDNIVLAFIFPFVNWHSMFSAFNKCADAVGR